MGAGGSKVNDGDARFNLSNRKLRMVALDLDDTLLRSDQTVSEETLDCLRRLDSQGFVVAIATGRYFAKVHPYVCMLNLPHPMPVVAVNGCKGMLVSPSAIFDSAAAHPHPPLPRCDEAKTIFDRRFSRESISYVAQFARRLKCISMCLFESAEYQGGNGTEPLDTTVYAYANGVRPQHAILIKQFEQITKLSTRIALDDNFTEQLRLYGLPHRMVLACRPARFKEMHAAAFEELSGKHASIVHGGSESYIELLPAGVNKGLGLKLMCQHLNIPIEECVCMGDAQNDVEFLQMAGLGICMKNGRDAAKAAADRISQWTNNEDAVRQELERLEQAGRLQGCQTTTGEKITFSSQL